MSIGADVLSSQPVVFLRDMYAAEYASPAITSANGPAPAMLNALGACAGFAAQIAVWRELVLPKNRNPGDFLAFVTTPSRDVLFFGEAINQFLFLTGSDRVSFLSLAAGPLTNASQLPDIGELLGHVVQSIGSDSFGRPRVPPSIDLHELPRTALARTWGKTAQILKNCRPAEWPALLGAAAQTIINTSRTLLAPQLAVKIVLEAAAPMSKLNPVTVEDSGVPAPSFANWSMRARRPENQQTIVAEVRAAMPAIPAGIETRSPIIDLPQIVFLNLAGASCAAIAAEDRAVIGELFGRNVQVTTVPVPCDVLFLYCDLEPSGKIVGQQGSLRSLIWDSKARVVVIASQVPTDFLSNREFQAALAKGDNPPVNLVITLNRNGDNFGRFFKSLFQMMWTGVPMPMAWGQLAPQVQGSQQRNDTPGTICLMGAGQVSFTMEARSRA
jgi:hypothetical protein